MNKLPWNALPSPSPRMKPIAAGPSTCDPENSGSLSEAGAMPQVKVAWIVGPHVAAAGAPRRKDRIVGGRGAVVVQPQDDPGEMCIVRVRTAELVVLLDRPEPGRRRAGRKVLKL